MALSNDELELQSTEYLPAREVMTGLGGNGHNWLCGGLVNVDADVHDIDIVKDVNILTGDDSDVVDIDKLFVGIF
ncbi:MAG TPA: hypothetical protein VK611_18580 [Acidimicrobiales bacterium]|nr:hypothetical protein [Acidimicrobiales bacterium]